MTTYHVLNFEKEQFQNLKEGKKYYVVYNDYTPIRYTGIFIGFKGIKTINAQFRNVSVLYPGFLLDNKKETQFFWSNNVNRIFYKLISVKDKIQERIEQTALNNIIRNIIGDEHFKWY